ncbi:MAG: MinD/ParA family protein [Lachnospiraceae bacterium]|nr:MinD/ParA family protein [Lachnospiraceae bacterium]MBO4559951.1 MinD/ParA family protein [Lachnospiraceae bacterium]MBO7352979.1 MinD/ParA family protein [Lachnospiraceae bacterium]MBP5653451.1 MinD/ParA family protein [Lachnospiraceae bacterium]MCR5428947.1 MinD/ParA family protein [Lachnospiraceae bacterium]
MDQADQLRKMVNKQKKVRKVSRVITVTSGKGGVGKSTLSVNLAIALSRMGKRVIILDADFGLANVEVMLGIRPQHNLADLMFRGKELKDIITEGPEGVGFISGGSGIQELSRLTRDQVIYLVQKLYELDELADIILVDTGAGIADTVLEFVSASNEVLVVATPEPTSITDAYALLKTLNRKSDFVKENTSIRMVANRIKDAEEGENLHQKLSVVVEKFLNIKVEYLGGILNDANCQKAVMQQDPVMLSFPNSNTASAIQKIAAKLIDVQLDNDDKSGIAHLFNRWMKTIYKKKKG